MATETMRRHLVGGRAWLGAALATAMLLAGCSSLTPTAVSPMLDGKAVGAAVADRTLLMAALQEDAGALGFVGTDWYEVALAGYNYVDDQCAVYFNSLFAFNRRTAAIKSGLTAFDKTSAAIMEITGVGSVTMSAIAQAFGLAGAMTDVVAGTFLYDLPPANTQRFVQKTMGAYKDAAANHRQSISSRASAYSSIRGYLNLCLPVTIEGQLIDRISDMKAEPKVNSSGPNIEIDVRPSASVLDNAEVALPPVTDVVMSPAGIGFVEQHIRAADWRKIQRALCVAEDGIPGTSTHSAMSEFFEGRDEPDPNIGRNGIGTVQASILSAAVAEAGGRTCTEREAANAFEVGRASK